MPPSSLPWERAFSPPVVDWLRWTNALRKWKGARVSGARARAPERVVTALAPSPHVCFARQVPAREPDIAPYSSPTYAAAHRGGGSEATYSAPFDMQDWESASNERNARVFHAGAICQARVVLCPWGSDAPGALAKPFRRPSRRPRSRGTRSLVPDLHGDPGGFRQHIDGFRSLDRGPTSHTPRLPNDLTHSDARGNASSSWTSQPQSKTHHGVYNTVV